MSNLNVKTGPIFLSIEIKIGSVDMKIGIKLVRLFFSHLVWGERKQRCRDSFININNNKKKMFSFPWKFDWTSEVTLKTLQFCCPIIDHNSPCGRRRQSCFCGKKIWWKLYREQNCTLHLVISYNGLKQWFSTSGTQELAKWFAKIRILALLGCFTSFWCIVPRKQ